jgi:hypothetical protein
MDKKEHGAVVGVQLTPDDNVRCFHVRHELTSTKAEVGYRGEFPELGALGRLVLEIRGVECVSVQAYSITVQKGAMFDWQIIQEKIVDILVDVCKSIEGIICYRIHRGQVIEDKSPGQKCRPTSVIQR